jgi:hypothetical protein
MRPAGIFRPLGFWASLLWFVIALVVSFVAAVSFVVLALLATNADDLKDEIFVEIIWLIFALVFIGVLVRAVRRIEWPARDYFAVVLPTRRVLVIAFIGACVFVSIAELLTLYIDTDWAGSGASLTDFRAARAGGAALPSAILSEPGRCSADQRGNRVPRLSLSWLVITSFGSTIGHCVDGDRIRRRARTVFMARHSVRRRARTVLRLVALAQRFYNSIDAVAREHQRSRFDIVRARNLVDRSASVPETVHQRLVLPAVNFDHGSVDHAHQRRGQHDDEIGDLIDLGDAPHRNRGRRKLVGVFV